MCAIAFYCIFLHFGACVHAHSMMIFFLVFVTDRLCFVALRSFCGVFLRCLVSSRLAMTVLFRGLRRRGALLRASSAFTCARCDTSLPPRCPVVVVRSRPQSSLSYLSLRSHKEDEKQRCPCSLCCVNACDPVWIACPVVPVDVQLTMKEYL